MNTEHFEQTKQNVQKVVNRIINSETYYYTGKSVWMFDDRLIIERYNSLYKVTFKDVTLGHFHSTDKSSPEYERFHDEIYAAIEARKKQEEKKVLAEL